MREKTGTGTPRVRHLEAFPVTVEGTRMMAVRDPAGWSESVLLVTPETLFIVSCLDGRQDLRDIQAACCRRYQEIVPLDQVRQVVDALDEALLLDSDRFREHRAAVEAEFEAAAVRAPASAGAAYEASPDRLRTSLDDLIEKGAGGTPLAGGRLAGLIAPHIDLHRGGAGYGAAYRAVADRCSSDLFVILGTAHASPAEPYVATRKAYDTPLGPVETDGDFIDQLSGLYGERLFNEEITHRKEHSIEFQSLFVRHLRPERPVRIVPILCSSFHEQVESRDLPRAGTEVKEFLAALRECLMDRPDACLIAGADLAHLGPRFGDPHEVSAEIAAWCEERDRASLASAASRDSEGFFLQIAEERDRRRICGLSAIYTLLEVLPEAASGQLLHYGQTLDEERTNFVSFASMAFIAPS